MSLASMLGMINNELKETFSRKPFDAAKGRQALLDGIERTREQFGRGEPVRGRKWFSVSNGIVAFSPTRGNSGPLTINGITTNYIPAESFPEFLDNMRAAVEAGEFDAEIEATERRTSMVSGTADVAIPSRKRAAPKHRAADAPARRADWNSLTIGQRQRVAALRRYGKNPDGSVIAEVGERPDAPILER